MEYISRNDITDKYYREILDVETHHDHLIYRDGDGVLRWEMNDEVSTWVSKIGLYNVLRLFDALGLNENSEVVRKLYRDMGYSLFGYWEAFYWKANNEIADEYNPENN